MKEETSKAQLSVKNKDNSGTPGLVSTLSGKQEQRKQLGNNHLRTG
jgi:hypothetical protein